mgnify:CR=1 FL=1
MPCDDPTHSTGAPLGVPDDERVHLFNSTMQERPLRILHLLLATESGGLSKYVLDLSVAVAEQGHRVTVAGDRGAWHDRFRDRPFELIEIPLKCGFGGFRRSTAILRERLARHPVDLIHTHYRRATLLARRARKACPGAPLLYTLHLSHISLRFPRNLFTDFGDHTHVASEDARDWLSRDAGVPPDRISYIPHGIEVERFPRRDDAARSRARAMLGLGDADRVVAFVGRLEDPKNASWLLDLAGATRGQFGNLRILLAGDGPDAPRLRDRIDAENLHDRVRLLGEIDPLPLYQSADALLLPSGREGFSYVCAEAMCVGVPVLRTRTSGTTATVVEGLTGRSTPIDRDAFVAAAIEFLSDQPRLREMGRAAAEHVRVNLNFREQVTRTLDLYRRLTRLAPSPGRPGIA